MFEDLILALAQWLCTQNVVLHILRFGTKSNQNKQHGDKGW